MTDRDRQDIFEDAIYNAGLTAQGCWENLDDYTQDAIKRLFTYAYRAGVAGEYDQFDRAGAIANQKPATNKEIDAEWLKIKPVFYPMDNLSDFRDGFRAAEQFYGIKKENKT